MNLNLPVRLVQTKGYFEPFSTKRRMARIEQIDECLRGTIDPEPPYGVDTSMCKKPVIV
jgi:hypothetical protein